MKTQRPYAARYRVWPLRGARRQGHACLTSMAVAAAGSAPLQPGNDLAHDAAAEGQHADHEIRPVTRSPPPDQSTVSWPAGPLADLFPARPPPPPAPPRIWVGGGGGGCGVWPPAPLSHRGLPAFPPPSLGGPGASPAILPARSAAPPPPALARPRRWHPAYPPGAPPPGLGRRPPPPPRPARRRSRLVARLQHPEVLFLCRCPLRPPRAAPAAARAGDTVAHRCSRSILATLRQGACMPRRRSMAVARPPPHRARLMPPPAPAGSAAAPARQRSRP